MLGALLALAQHAQAQPSASFSWMRNNDRTTWIKLLNTLDITEQNIPSNAPMTALVPSNKAVAAFLSRLGMTEDEFVKRKELVDLVTAYHVIPGFQAKGPWDIPENPTLAVTADVNYALRFYRNSSAAWVKDTQGNDALLEARPLQFGRISVIPISSVLLSGGYFFNGGDALRYYPQWSHAAAFATAAGSPEHAVGNGDVTFLVPDNAAFDKAGAALQSLSAEAKAAHVLYSATAPAKHIPSQLAASGSIQTLLPNHYLRVMMSPGAAGQPPVVKFTPEEGPAASVTIFNIYVGRGIFQGIDRLLNPKLAGQGIADVKRPKQLPAGRRLLLDDAQEDAAAGAGRSLLAANASPGFYQGSANTMAASNTAAAIADAANGRIPASYATRYGTAMTKSVKCYNCFLWADSQQP